MKIAIVGFSGCGKSTSFKAIAEKKKEESETLDPTKPHLAAVKIVDPRLNKLAELTHPKKVTHAEMVFEDLPGFHIPQIKDVEALVEVLGIFSGRDPVKDIKDMDAEFMLADLEIVQKRLPALEKELKAKDTPEKKRELDVLIKCKSYLEENTPLRTLDLTAEEEKPLKGFQFLSEKPLFILGNIGEDASRGEAVKKMEKFCGERGLACVEFSAKLESEIADLDESERDAFLKELGLGESARKKVVTLAFKALGYITFFTVKGNETKAWPIKKGRSAIEAAGKIHSDIQKGFIKAEVINFTDLVACGSKEEARKKGLLKLEAKEYKIRDGDIVDFRFSK